ncbi:unnamed protein product [Scytosiphon promiscuus]
MVEADDFGAGTSGRSTKLIHGGIRYLETAFKKLDIESYHLVEEALEERAYMLQAAPYMNNPLPIMIPIYKWWEVPYMWIGAKVYDWVAGAKLVVPPSHYMSREEAIYNFPKLREEGLKGAIIYYDGQMNDARMSLVVALTATQQGACIANRVKVIGLLKDENGQMKGATVQDTITKETWEVAAKSVINATGCFCDAIRKMDDPDAKNLVMPAAGVHIMLPAHFSPDKMGLIVPKTSDGRVLFFLPWEGATIVGTTDSESELTMTPKPTDEEVNFIIQESNRYLSHRVHRTDVIAAWSGIRPLVRDPKLMDEEGTKALSRNHVIEISDSKMVTITGGKWTTFRRMAEDTVNATQASIPDLDEENAIEKEADTALGSLIGADRAGVVCARNWSEGINVILREEYSLSCDVAKHLVSNYGTRALQIAEIVKRNKGYAHSTAAARCLAIKYPYLEAEVVFAVEQEYALKAVDVLARRTRLAFVDSKAAMEAAPRVIEIMAGLLGWSRARRREEMREVEQFLETMSPAAPSGKSGRRSRRT